MREEEGDRDEMGHLAKFRPTWPRGVKSEISFGNKAAFENGKVPALADGPEGTCDDGVALR